MSVFDVDEVEGPAAREDKERKGGFVEVREESDPVLADVELVCVFNEMGHLPVVGDQNVSRREMDGDLVGREL